MIALDGSALFAVILDEPMAELCDQVLRAAGTELIMSSASLAETLIVAAGKNLFDEMQAFIAALQPTIIPLTEPRARAAAEAYRRWAKTSTPRASILATPLLMRWRWNMPARCSSSATISRRLIWFRRWRGEDYAATLTFCGRG